MPRERSGTERETADESIDAYFEWLDTLDYDGPESSYTTDLELGWPDGRVKRGWDGVLEFYRTERRANDAHHRTRQRIYGGSRGRRG